MKNRSKKLDEIEIIKLFSEFIKLINIIYIKQIKFNKNLLIADASR